MELALLTLEQVMVLFSMILAGFVCVKTGAVKMEGRKHFSDLMMTLTVPAMMVHSYLMEFDPTVFSNLVTALGWSAAAFLLGFLITFLITWRMKDPALPILRCTCVFSNAAYMGFPLIQALFGSEGMLYASAFVTILNLFLWSVQYSMLTGKVNPREIVHTLLTMPTLIAIFIGLAIYLGRIPVAEPIERVLNMVGSMTTPLSMIITGMIIAGIDVKKQLRDKRLALIVLIRMILIPAACFGLFVLLGAHGMSAVVILLLMSGPSAAVSTVFAVQFGYDEEMTAGAVVITTFLSIFALPCWAFLLGTVLG